MHKGDERNMEQLPGIDVTASRLDQIRDYFRPHEYRVSYRMNGRPFVPESVGYNRSDGPAEPIAELQDLSPFVMRHRRRGGRVLITHLGHLECQRCGAVFATLRGGRNAPGQIRECGEEAAVRDPETHRLAKAQIRAADNLKDILALGPNG